MKHAGIKQNGIDLYEMVGNMPKIYCKGEKSKLQKSIYGMTAFVFLKMYVSICLYIYLTIHMVTSQKWD